MIGQWIILGILAAGAALAIWAANNKNNGGRA